MPRLPGCGELGLSSPIKVLSITQEQEGATAMVLEVLIVLLLIGAVGATTLSFFVVRSNRADEKSATASKHDVDNPQRDIDGE